jgi:hypothetical protein
MWGSLDRESDAQDLLYVLKIVLLPADSLASRNAVFLIAAMCLWQIIRSFNSKLETSVLKTSKKTRKGNITVLWKLSVSKLIRLLSLLYNEYENVCWSRKYGSCLKLNTGRRRNREDKFLKDGVKSWNSSRDVGRA